MTPREKAMAVAVLGLLDALTPAQVEAAIKGTNKGARITVSPTSLKRLLDFVETMIPGVLASYQTDHAARTTERKRGSVHTDD